MIKSAAQSSILNDTRYTSMSAGVVPSSEYLIESRVLDTAVSSVTFSDLTQYAGIYKHLQICMVAQSTQSGTGSGGVVATISLNGSAMTKSHYLYSNGSGVVSGVGSVNGFFINLVRSGSTNQFSASVADILDPFSTIKNKTVRWVGGYPSEICLASNLWENTNAVTSITISTSADNFSIGSRFSLYGVTA
jgi:hypothetical protein